MQPNILFITCHDIGRHLHCYGLDAVESPHFDALAAAGVRFAQAFCTAPQCSPSRASMFTGRYPHNTGVMGLTHKYFAWDLHADERHLAQHLNDAGYHTAGLGIIHESRRHERPGFEVLLHAASAEAPDITATAVQYIREQRPQDQPFYLQVGYVEPHRRDVGYQAAPYTQRGVNIPPYLVNEPTAYEDLAYFQGSIRKVDAALGDLLAALDDVGLRDNTLVIFTADHGIPYPRAKCSLYDPGLEVALMMRWPGGPLEAGQVVDAMVSNTDILPTIFDLLDLPLPGNVQGTSLLPLLRGEVEQVHETLYGEMTYHDYCDPRRSLRTTTHKLIVNFTAAPFFMDPSQQWRPNTITVHPARPEHAYHEPVELYDLRADPLEQRNLAYEAEHADLCRDLLRQLYNWMTETDDPLLHGIPTPPMHDMALRALRDGEL